MRGGGSSRRVVCAGVCVWLAAAAGPARAQCSTPNSSWTGTFTAPAAVSSAPSSDTFFNYAAGGSISYVANGNTIYAYRNVAFESQAAGSQKWAHASGGTIQNFPIPVPLTAPCSGLGCEKIFYADLNGFVHKIDVQSGTDEWSGSLKADLRRLSCSTDQVTATPTIQLYNSNTVFKAAMDKLAGTKDLVFVITHFGCSTVTQNRLYALDARDGTPVWTFNSTGTQWMDFGAAGCYLDASQNILYCGTNLPSSNHNQNTLWAIQSYNGKLLWSTNAGSIHSVALLANTHLYVAQAEGSLRIYDPPSGALLYIAPVTDPKGPTLERNPWAEFRSGGYGQTVLLVDSGGSLHSFIDPGSNTSLGLQRAWGPVNFGDSVFSMPAAFPSLGKGYVGMKNGNVIQFDLWNGALDANTTVGGGSANDPGLDVEAANDINRLTVASTQLKRYCVPWTHFAVGTSSLPTGDVGPDQVPPHPQPLASCINPLPDCDFDNHPGPSGCVSAACAFSGANGVCYADPTAWLGKSCTGSVCGASGTCKAGVCLLADYSSCTCTVTGGPGCKPPTSCCAGSGCIDLLTNPSFCGACNHSCAAGQICVGGACVRNVGATAVCNATGAATLNMNVASMPAGLNDIAYDHVSGTCNAYLSGAAIFGTASALVKVPPGGPPLTVETVLGNTAPESGVAVSFDGLNWFGALLNLPGAAGPSSGMHFVHPAFGQNAVPLTASNSFSSEPFSVDADYDNGPVGPAFNTEVYTGAAGSPLRAYYANWKADGAGTIIGAVWSIDGTNVTGGSYGFADSALVTEPGRVTALAYSKLAIRQGVQVGVLWIGYIDSTSGHVMLHVYCDGNTNVPGVGGCVSLPSAANPIDLTVASGVKHLQDISTDTWVFGDAYLVVSDGANLHLLVVRADDFSVSNLANVDSDLLLAPAVPSSFVGDSRIGVAPTLLERLTISSHGSMTAAFTDYGIVN